MRISKPNIPRPNITGRITNNFVWQWKLFIIAGMLAVIGGTLAIAGPVLLAMMAFSGQLLGVVGAAAMFAVGIALILIVYLWLTL